MKAFIYSELHTRTTTTCLFDVPRHVNPSLNMGSQLPHSKLRCLDPDVMKIEISASAAVCRYAKRS